MRLVTYILFFIFLVISIGCKDDFQCMEIDQMPAFSELENIEGVREETGIKLIGGIEDPLINNKQTFIVHDQDTYDRLIDFSHQQGCTECNLPKIDFEERTLIGLYSHEECGFFFFKNISRVSEKEYKFVVKAVSLEQCEQSNCLNESFNWISIPKISSNAIVRFTYVKQYFDCDCK